MFNQICHPIEIKLREMWAYKDASTDIGCFFEHFCEVFVFDLFHHEVQVVGQLNA